MLVIDIVKPEPKTVLEANTDFWNAFKARQVRTSTFSKKIPVQTLETCMVCRTQFMAIGWEYCSDKCDELAAMFEDEARDV